MYLGWAYKCFFVVAEGFLGRQMIRKSDFGGTSFFDQAFAEKSGKEDWQGFSCRY